MLDVFGQANADVVVAFEEVAAAEVYKYGIAVPRGPISEQFELKGVVEKPPVNEAPSNLAVAARYVFKPVIFEELAATKPDQRGEIQLTDAIQSLLSKGGKGIGMRLAPSERRFDIGNFESYFRAFIDFALADPNYGESLSAYVRSRLNDGD